MHTIIVAVLLALGASPQQAAAPPKVAEGTLLFFENVNSVVEYSTRGNIGHVALAFHDGEEAFLYEATPARVRRVRADEYVAELARLNQRRDADERIRVWALRPKQAYSADDVSKMREYLDAQIGRRYSVRNYVRRRPADGIHCAEMASTALNLTGRYGFEDCAHIHPQALYTAMKPLSAAPQEIEIPSLAAKESWCIRAQRRTAEWFTWCGWSCREAWSWCW